MAELYLARADGIEGFEKLVALKRILPQLAADEAFMAMFLEEARLAATLQHPNVVQVFDIGQESGQFFFAMEYVRGQDLRAIFKAAQKSGLGMPLSAAMTITMGACAGLHHAHEKTDARGRSLGIVHRDVSPPNILVTYDGCVKVVDFGIAKARVRSSRTPTGLIKGKLAYMSPEQCQGHRVDRRSDVFAAGILLYELTTGLPLFRASSDWGIFKKIVFEEIPLPSRKRKGYPASLEAIVMKALARDPDQRYRTAEELQCALEEFAREQRIAASNVVLSRYMTRLFPGGDVPTREMAKRALRARAARSPSEPPAGEVLPVVPERRRRRWTRPLAIGAVAMALLGLLSIGELASDDDPPLVRATEITPLAVPSAPTPPAPAPAAAAAPAEPETIAPTRKPKPARKKATRAKKGKKRRKATR